MKIILICSSLEPGRDGVGDYARRLAASLIKKEHTVALLALNDRHVNTITESIQHADRQEISTFRIPALSLKKNTLKVKAWIDAFKPDWLSLQCVIFGYHPKGLPFGLSKQLLAIGGNRRWHIMFHELWLGMAKQESLKLKLWGTVQRYLIQSLISNLQPGAIHTQTKLYQQHLAKLGYQAGYLSIFSNIPVKPDVIVENDPNIRLIVFGLIHTGAAIELLAAEAGAYFKKHQTQVSLIFAGHCGSEQNRWAGVWQQAGLPVQILGKQTESEISILLQQATLGISSTAVAVVEKSGAFAAMRDHQLPVLNISKPWAPRGLPAPEVPKGMAVYQPGGFKSILAERDKYKATGIDPDTIAQQMLTDLLKNG